MNHFAHMKTITLLGLFAALCVSAFAGLLTDDANMFGPRAAEVSNAISSLPVWIETRVQAPSEGLKAYADRRAAEVGSKAFYAVLTTQPRAWRISMNPVGVASSEAVRMAGEQMVARFRRGEFAPGAIALARDLDRLANPPPLRPVVRTHQAAPVQKENNEWMWWVGGVVALVLVVCLIVWLINRSVRKEEEAERAADRAARRRDYIPAGVPNQTEAKRVFDSYTPAQRETLIRDNHHHHYSSGAGTDPLLFWMMLNATQPHYYAQPAPAPRYDPPASTPSYDSSPSSSDSSGSSSSSYDSGSSSSSYDSGSSSSSFDSGSSSSDSSGGGGSW